ncbi:helix-turn-helix domain-containing protein [Clostridium beijerinckii]|uniref:Nuclease with TOPRIM domain n=1 Tax=Clostridium beijerinckii TaxID=1520 RepID=A0AAX0AVA4_CLOBE|nr:helix-turn-helix domain-containing protein [Clostridium beijerinckii]MBA8934327.1 putative nuclease with TOPRIM domain [Clostridium beijerinckii]NOW04767.1 putative nuclease with TOPRIM domain [Clostridium beijerinckii]NRT86846.1 putative nuclease with TOPRIM domain [Clostridium beijerinckii]NRU38516.1 putative nuclease with TOPRIM domain [Clostridium beijerinckii]NSA98205.1 putative nuclease with TOPRIM domain [Clostridium beijerinckii]
MEKLTIEGLQEQVNLYKEKIESVIKENARLCREIEEIKADKSAVSVKEYDILLSNLESLKSELEEYKNLYFREKQRVRVRQVKNSRNVGRKPVSDELRNRALNLKEQGLNIRSIAKELNIALGTVLKIVNEQK